ncbi:MAG: hypothetical protein KGI38_11735 [Thaumarchaeota archaeon]|nr:hypothetical protein [Nitrososphaerota archaeon]
MKRCLNCWLRADEAEITLRDMVDDDKCEDPKHNRPASGFRAQIVDNPDAEAMRAGGGKPLAAAGSENE